MFQHLRLPIVFVLVLAAAVSAPVSAATDIFLKLQGDGKVVATASVAADGSFRFEQVPDGDYFVEFQMDGRTYSSAASPKGRATGGDSPAESIRVTTAREAGSGMATGRRMHKPITITKEWDAASPKLMLSVAGSTVSGGISGGSSSGVSTTRSSVEN